MPAPEVIAIVILPLLVLLVVVIAFILILIARIMERRLLQALGELRFEPAYDRAASRGCLNQTGDE